MDDAGTSAATDPSVAGNGYGASVGSLNSLSIESGRTMMRVTQRSTTARSERSPSGSGSPRRRAPPAGSPARGSDRHVYVVDVWRQNSHHCAVCVRAESITRHRSRLGQPAETERTCQFGNVEDAATTLASMSRSRSLSSLSTAWAGLDIRDYPHSLRVARGWRGYTLHICALLRPGHHVETHMWEWSTPTQTQ